MRRKKRQEAIVTHNDPDDHGKVPVEEAARIQSMDLPTGDPGGGTPAESYPESREDDLARKRAREEAERLFRKSA